VLSSRVKPPENISNGSSTSRSGANWGIVHAKVTRNLPSEIVAITCGAAPHRNRATESWLGTDGRNDVNDRARGESELYNVRGRLVVPQCADRVCHEIT
jgi:hypothetical protein